MIKKKEPVALNDLVVETRIGFLPTSKSPREFLGIECEFGLRTEPSRLVLGDFNLSLQFDPNRPLDDQRAELEILATNVARHLSAHMLPGEWVEFLYSPDARKSQEGGRRRSGGGSRGAQKD